MNRTLLVIVAVTCFAGCLVIALVSFLAVLDPAGSKHADDGDPFGEPPSRWGSAIFAMLGVIGAVVSARVLVAMYSRR